MWRGGGGGEKISKGKARENGGGWKLCKAKTTGPGRGVAKGEGRPEMQQNGAGGWAARRQGWGGWRWEREGGQRSDPRHQEGGRTQAFAGLGEGGRGVVEGPLFKELSRRGSENDHQVKANLNRRRTSTIEKGWGGGGTGGI